MVILKKIGASTLMETLVATVLVVVVFMIASMILNNLFSNTIKNNTNAIETYINELQYLYKRDHLLLPYYDDFNSWEIEVLSNSIYGNSVVIFEAINSETKQNYIKEISANQN